MGRLAAPHNPLLPARPRLLGGRRAPGRPRRSGGGHTPSHGHQAMAARSRAAKRAARNAAAVGGEVAPRSVASGARRGAPHRRAMGAGLPPPATAERGVGRAEDHPTSTAPSWAASCGRRGRDRGGGRCPRSSASGREPTGARPWVKSRACGSVSSGFSRRGRCTGTRDEGD